MNTSKDEQYANESAYGKDLAIDYDSRRFSDAAGKKIHLSEFSVLGHALGNIEAGSKVLEVGCGTGRLMVEVSNKGFLVDGADASGPMLAEASAKFPDLDAGKSPKFMLCEANQVPADSESYDLTYAIRLLNQTESPEYALTIVSEMLRLTKPSGFVLVEFINHYRPRIGKNKRPTTRLKPKDVNEVATREGGMNPVWYGAFFLSMQGYKASPPFLLPAVTIVDGLLSRFFPRLCSRTYLLVQKK